MSKDIELDIDSQEEEFKLNIRLGKYLVRRLDKFNIVVEEIRVTKTGENIGAEYGVNVGYYKELKTALKKLLALDIDSKKITTIKEAIQALKDSEDKLYEALESKYKNLEEVK